MGLSSTWATRLSSEIRACTTRLASSGRRHSENFSLSDDLLAGRALWKKIGLIEFRVGPPQAVQGGADGVRSQAGGKPDGEVVRGDLFESRRVVPNSWASRGVGPPAGERPPGGLSLPE